MYTSPHLFTFRERIQINGTLISEEEFSDYVDYVWKKEGDKLLKYGFYDISIIMSNIATLISLMYLKNKSVDIAVIETGIGGRIDATNIINPLLSVITSIGFDHCELIGDTMEKIAFEKAGIIKPGKPVVLGSELPVNYLSKIAESRNSTIYLTEKGRDLKETHNNICNKIMEVLILQYKFDIPIASIEYGNKCEQKCRMEYVDKKLFKSDNGPDIILDVGHNITGLVIYNT